MEDWAIAQANEFIAEAELYGIDISLSNREMEKHTIGPLPLNYAGVDLFDPPLESFVIPGLSQQDIQSMSRNENFWRAAFKTKMNTMSIPTVQGNNVLVIIPIEEVNVEETLGINIASNYSSGWVYFIAEQSMPYYFLSNERMEDNFLEIYIRYFSPMP
jgi:hypothetical protein